MRKTKGVALLIALSVTLILSIFLFNNFERNHTNLKFLSNTESKFSLNTVSFSVLKAISLAIKENGANYVYDFVSIIGSIPDFPVNITQEPSINIYNPIVWSMQHYYYLNKKFNTAERRFFNGILNQNLEGSLALEGNNQKISLAEKSFTDELNQWYQNTLNSNFIADFPIYRRYSYFDLESEFYFFLLQALRKKGIDFKETFQERLTFRIYSTAGKDKIKLSDDLSSKSECSLSPLNLNMLPKNNQDESKQIVQNYLEWFDFHSKKECRDLKKKEESVIKTLENQFFQAENILLIPDIGNNHFQKNLAGIDNSIKPYFTHRSNLIGVKYELEHNSSRIQVEIHFYLEYKSDNATDMPDSVFILYYNVS